MKIWLIQLGEPLPTDGDIRLYRTGVLASKLVERGHTVTWWASTFHHTHKRQRFLCDHRVQLEPNYTIELLYERGYQRNVSFKRVKFHRQMALKLSRRFWQSQSPDIIFTSLPTPELSDVAVHYAVEHDIPVVVDVRDLWPDIFKRVLPRGLRWFGDLVLLRAFQRNQRIFHKATGIIAISNEYLQWALDYAGRMKRKTDRVFPLGYERITLSQEEALREKNDLLKMGVDPNKVICCFFGVFGRTYDLETVLEALKVLEGGGGNEVQFVLCGDGEKAGLLRSMSDELQNVVFPGWVSRTAIGVVLNMADIGLAPYVRDAPQSLPNKPFEYFSAGLPVLSSLKGELEQILAQNECGITYEAGNVNSLLKNLRYLLMESKERRRMGDNAARLFEERFSADRIYPRMIDYLEWMESAKS
jgi:glycosyltransferase involved in cell wall biosynthesis